MPLLFYPWAKNHWDPLNRRLGGPWSQSGGYGEEISLLPLPEFEPWIIQLFVSS